MSKAHPQHRLTADAYLEWEAEQTERHEFVQGEVFAMLGGTQVVVSCQSQQGMALTVAELFDGVEFPVARDAKPISPPNPG